MVLHNHWSISDKNFGLKYLRTLLICLFILTPSFISALEADNSHNSDFFLEKPVEFLINSLTDDSGSKFIQHDIQCKLIPQFSYFNLKDDNPLNPDNILDIPTYKSKLYLETKMNFYFGNKVSLISKFRPELYSDKSLEESDQKLYIDDLYFDMSIGLGSFFYVGKKNICTGVAFGANPTNFLGEGKAVDTTKKAEERRALREGNYLAGMNLFFDNITLSMATAPWIDGLQEEKTRFSFKGDFLLDTLNTDFSLLYFNSQKSGIGMNTSTSIGEPLVLYTETALRWGKTGKKLKLTKEGIPNISPDIYTLEQVDNSYLNLVFGGQYTFNDGTNVICEYIYNGAGYNQDEWNFFYDVIDYSYKEYKKDFVKESMQTNLLQANDIMDFNKMRKHYIFARINNSYVRDDFDKTLVCMLNTDDSSFLINPSIDYKINPNMVIGLSSTIFIGDMDSEFGLLYWSDEHTIKFEYFF
jgi:hypothetical protein